MHPYVDIKSITSPNQCLSWWMVHAFLYYRLDSPILSDKDFDTLTSWVKMSWHSITHIHKNLVTLDNLNAGTAYNIEFPLMIEGSANHVLREVMGNKSETSSKNNVKKQAKRIAKDSKPNKTFNEYDSLFT